MIHNRIRALAMFGAAVVTAAGGALLAGGTASASPASSPGVVTHQTDLYACQSFSCASNGPVYPGDALIVDCGYPYNGGWYFVHDNARHNRGWIFSSYFALEGPYPGNCP